ncbi:zinc-binding dehydrogenase [Spirosoma rhododendri]|uniref:zinc-binding dehydrogenase n=1 Tax=Spirosoma rhododendri TaxID=2728024 RepID=UPI001C2CBAE8|nr:zinc-binding dehydrogenase [Spirosoma rhododendri]
MQLATAWGADVIGLAGQANHAWLRDHGVTPVDYRPDAEKAVREALQGRQPAALFDCSGAGYVDLALSLGIPADRINTIADFTAVAKYKVKSVGSAAASNADVLAELAGLIDAGKLEFPVAGSYPLSDVKAAYDDLDAGHTHGKIVLIPW